MDSSFEANFNLRNKEGDYNLLAELIADKNNIPFSSVKIYVTDKTAIPEHNDYGFRDYLRSK
jgi:hypothetical protein